MLLSAALRHATASPAPRAHTSLLSSPSSSSPSSSLLSSSSSSSSSSSLLSSSLLARTQQTALSSATRALTTQSTMSPELKRKVDAMKAARPISPHLTIYNLYQVHTVCSVTHRGTGMWLSGVLTYFSYKYLGGGEFASLVDSMRGTLLLPLVKASLGFSLTFHTLAGFRHLVWDETNNYLDLEDVHKTGYIMLGVSAVAGVFFAFASFE